MTFNMKHCRPEDIGLKSFFLGPQSENGVWLQSVLNDLLSEWFAWRKSVYPQDGNAISKDDQDLDEFLQQRRRFEESLSWLSKCFEQEVPQFSPRYMGHMFSEISLPAFLGHFVTLLHNPNNISAEASRVGVRIENEAIASLSKMVGYDPLKARGHFTSGGTLANFEGLVRAKLRSESWLTGGSVVNADASTSAFECAHMGWNKFSLINKTQNLTTKFSNPLEFAKHIERKFGIEYKGPVVLVSNSMHYSWKKGAQLMGLGSESLWGIDLNQHGRLCIDDLQTKIEKAYREDRPILMVTSIMGTTERGSIDDLHLVADVLDKWASRGIHIWHHVDAAYGAFFRTLPRDPSELSTDRIQAVDALPRSNSITLDPHKLGYVPYSCGTFLVKSALEYSSINIDAPYIDFNPDTDRGPQTLEGSRPASGAAATWMTDACIGFNPDGYGRIIERTLKATSRLEKLIKQVNPNIRVLPDRDTNILCFCVAKDGEPLSKSNLRALEIFRKFSPAENSSFIVSKTALRWGSHKSYLENFTSQWRALVDVDSLNVVRLCLMNPFYESREMNTDFSIEFSNQLIEILRDLI